MRLGEYRILYEIADERLTVLVIRIAKRSEAYQQCKLGNPALTRLRKERALRKQAAQAGCPPRLFGRMYRPAQRRERALRKHAALLGFSLQPANSGAVS